jgi:hypothetical protein
MHHLWAFLHEAEAAQAVSIKQAFHTLAAMGARASQLHAVTG